MFWCNNGRNYTWKINNSSVNNLALLQHLYKNVGWFFAFTKNPWLWFHTQMDQRIQFQIQFFKKKSHVLVLVLKIRFDVNSSFVIFNQNLWLMVKLQLIFKSIIFFLKKFQIFSFNSNFTFIRPSTFNFKNQVSIHILILKIKFSFDLVLNNQNQNQQFSPTKTHIYPRWVQINIA